MVMSDGDSTNIGKHFKIMKHDCILDPIACPITGTGLHFYINGQRNDDYSRKMLTL